MKRLIALLVVALVAVLAAGCGSNNGIEGTWAPKNPSNQEVSKITFTKESDLLYKGNIEFANGKTFEGTFDYYEAEKRIRMVPTSVSEKKTKLNMSGGIAFNFNDDFSKAYRHGKVSDDYVYIKK